LYFNQLGWNVQKFKLFLITFHLKHVPFVWHKNSERRNQERMVAGWKHNFKTRLGGLTQGWNRAGLKKKQRKKKPGVTRKDPIKNPVATRWLFIFKKINSGNPVTRWKHGTRILDQTGSKIYGWKAILLKSDGFYPTIIFQIFIPSFSKYLSHHFFLVRFLIFNPFIFKFVLY